jgi:hypothetical protein
MRLLFLLATATLLCAAGPQPDTIGPPATGSMYNWNNVHRPQLRPSQEEVTSQATGSEQTTGAQGQGGRGAAHGGGG